MSTEQIIQSHLKILGILSGAGMVKTFLIDDTFTTNMTIHSGMVVVWFLNGDTVQLNLHSFFKQQFSDLKKLMVDMMGFLSLRQVVALVMFYEAIFYETTL